LSTKKSIFCLNRFESTTINEMKPPKRQRKQSAKSQMTQGSGPKRQKTSNRQQRKETDGYNMRPVVSRSNTRTFTDIQAHNDGNNRQNDTSMNVPTPSTSGWPGRNPSHTQTMHDARTHGHTSAESSSETLRHTQVSGTETRPVDPAQNTDHELSPDRERHLYNLRRHTFPASNVRQQAHCPQKVPATAPPTPYPLCCNDEQDSAAVLLIFQICR
jgi:hypothetical protein